MSIVVFEFERKVADFEDHADGGFSDEGSHRGEEAQRFVRMAVPNSVVGKGAGRQCAVKTNGQAASVRGESLPA